MQTITMSKEQFESIAAQDAAERVADNLFVMTTKAYNVEARQLWSRDPETGEVTVSVVD